MGFDPMNAIKVSNLVYHRDFLKIKDGDEELFFKGPIISVHNTRDLFKIESIYFINT